MKISKYHVIVTLLVALSVGVFLSLPSVQLFFSNIRTVTENAIVKEKGNTGQKSEQCGQWVLAENGVLPEQALVGGQEYKDSQLFVCRTVAPNGSTYPGKFIPSFGCFTAIEGGEMTNKSFNESYITWSGWSPDTSNRIERRKGYRPEVFIVDGCETHWVNTGANNAPRNALTVLGEQDDPLYICRAKLSQIGDSQPDGIHIGYMGWSTNHECRISWSGRTFNEHGFEVLQAITLHRLPPWAYVPTAFIIFALLTIATYYFRPLWLLSVQDTIAKLGPVGEIKIQTVGLKLGDLLNVVNLFTIPFLVKAPRTLDAWVCLHRNTWRETFEKEPTVLRCTQYVSLPCRLDDPENGELIREPGENLLTVLFSGNHVAEIVGAGGAGKTMLTIQICRWALDIVDSVKDRPAITALPVLVEEDTTDLLATLRRKLIAGLDVNDVSPDLLRALLARGRILVVFDRLSERSDTTVEYIRRIHGGLKIGRMLVSTRRSIDYECRDTRRLWPVPLASDSMMLFMSSIISAQTSNGVFKSIDEQIELAKRLAVLIKHGNRELPLTPLLVRMFVDRAVQLVTRGEDLRKLPVSVPQAYFDYLRDVNPKEPGQPHGMNDEAMLRAARLLAVVSLGENFIPQDFEKSIANEKLKEGGWTDLSKLDPIERLKLNGVMIERSVGSRQYISFALDPVAEYLAADEHLAQRNSSEDIQKFFTKIGAKGEVTKGFQLALELTLDLYKGVRNEQGTNLTI